ncbi:hypothetical protein HK098_001598 [Nowakowskiella sp. JEL0407]|nr:hypothetical protein HK098_001598 [Nowakowskiella sp. JEL0407]
MGRSGRRKNLLLYVRKKIKRRQLLKLQALLDYNDSGSDAAKSENSYEWIESSHVLEPGESDSNPEYSLDNKEPTSNDVNNDDENTIADEDHPFSLENTHNLLADISNILSNNDQFNFNLNSNPLSLIDEIGDIFPTKTSSDSPAANSQTTPHAASHLPVENTQNESSHVEQLSTETVASKISAALGESIIGSDGYESDSNESAKLYNDIEKYNRMETSLLIESLKDLTEQNKGLKRRLDLYKDQSEQLRDLEVTNKELISQLNENEAEISRFSNIIDEKQNQTTMLENHVNFLQEQLNAAHEELSQTKKNHESELSMLNEQLKEKDEKLSQLTVDFKTLNTTFETQQEEVQILNESLDVSTIQIQNNEDELELLKSHNQKLSDDLKKASGLLESKSVQCELYLTENDRLRGDLEIKNGEIIQLRSELEAEKLSRDSLSELQVAMKELSKAKMKLETELNENLETIEALRAENAVLKADVRGTEHHMNDDFQFDQPVFEDLELGVNPEELSRLNEQLDEVTSNLKQVQDQLNLKTVEYEELVRQYAEEKERLDSSLLQAQEQYALAKENEESLQSRVKSVEANLNETSEKHKEEVSSLKETYELQLKEQNAKAYYTFHEFEKRYATKCADLELELTHAKTALEENQVSIVELSQTKVENAKLQSMIQQLESQVADQTKSITEIKELIEKEKHRYHSLEAVLNELKMEKLKAHTKSKRDSTMTSILLEQEEFDLLGESVDKGFKAWLGNVDEEPKSALSVDGSDAPDWKEESSLLIVSELGHEPKHLTLSEAAKRENVPEIVVTSPSRQVLKDRTETETSDANELELQLQEANRKIQEYKVLSETSVATMELYRDELSKKQEKLDILEEEVSKLRMIESQRFVEMFEKLKFFPDLMCRKETVSNETIAPKPSEPAEEIISTDHESTQRSKDSELALYRTSYNIINSLHNDMQQEIARQKLIIESISTKAESPSNLIDQINFDLNIAQSVLDDVSAQVFSDRVENLRKLWSHSKTANALLYKLIQKTESGGRSAKEGLLEIEKTLMEMKKADEDQQVMMENEIAEATAIISNLEKERDSAIRKAMDLKQILTDFESNYNMKMKHRLKELQREKKAMEDAHASKVKTLIDKIRSYEVELEKVAKQPKNANSYSEMSNANQVLNENVAEAESYITRLKEKLSSLEREVDFVRSQGKEIRESRDSKIKKLELENSQLRTSLDELRAENIEQSDELSKLEAQLNELRGEAERLIDSEEVMKRLETENSELKSNLEILEHNIEVIETEAKNMESQLRKKLKHFQTENNRKVEEARMEAAKQIQDMNEMKAKLQEKVKDLAKRLKKDEEKMRQFEVDKTQKERVILSELSSVKGVLAQREDLWMKERSSLEEALAKLQEDFDKVSRALVQKEAAWNAEKTKFVHSKTEQVRSMAGVEKLITENTSLRERITSLLAEKRSLKEEIAKLRIPTHAAEVERTEEEAWRGSLKKGDYEALEVALKNQALVMEKKQAMWEKMVKDQHEKIEKYKFAVKELRRRPGENNKVAPESSNAQVEEYTRKVKELESEVQRLKDEQTLLETQSQHEKERTKKYATKIEELRKHRQESAMIVERVRNETVSLKNHVIEVEDSFVKLAAIVTNTINTVNETNEEFLRDGNQLDLKRLKRKCEGMIREIVNSRFMIEKHSMWRIDLQYQKTYLSIKIADLLASQKFMVRCIQKLGLNLRLPFTEPSMENKRFKCVATAVIAAIRMRDTARTWKKTLTLTRSIKLLTNENQSEVLRERLGIVNEETGNKRW